MSLPANPVRYRSLLFVPGDDDKKLASSADSDADAVVLDLEDAVLPEHKKRARKRVAERIADITKGPSIAVRVNPATTPHFEADMRPVLRAGARHILLPKFDTKVLSRAASTVADAGRSTDQVAVWALIESAGGVADLPSSLTRAPGLKVMAFGNLDFAVDMGVADPNPSRGVIHHARCTLAIAARASGAVPIDGVCPDLGDGDAFLAEATHARTLGFEGKLCIHPSQVTIANRVFAPSEAEIQEALDVLNAAEEARRQGAGVFTRAGKMVDAPIIAAHERVLRRAGRGR